MLKLQAPFQNAGGHESWKVNRPINITCYALAKQSGVDPAQSVSTVDSLPQALCLDLFPKACSSYATILWSQILSTLFLILPNGIPGIIEIMASLSLGGMDLEQQLCVYMELVVNILQLHISSYCMLQFTVISCPAHENTTWFYIVAAVASNSVDNITKGQDVCVCVMSCGYDHSHVNNSMDIGLGYNLYVWFPSITILQGHWKKGIKGWCHQNNLSITRVFATTMMGTRN